MSTGSSAVDQEAFNKAIFSHDFSFAEDLLSKVNIETQDYNGYTFLLKACVRNDVQVFEWLVQHGADINAQDRSSRNAMFIAIETISVDIIKWLADDKRLLHTTYRGKNPLHEAVLMNQLDIVKLLVNAKLNPYEQTPFKANAFDLAHAQSDTAILEWLLTNKSFNILEEFHDEKTKVATLENLFDKYGYQFLNVKSDERNLTIADYAADMQQIEVLKWLKSKNVLTGETPPSVPTTSKDVCRSFDEAVFNHAFDVASKLLLRVDLETRDYHGNTYLMKACVSNDIEAFKWLMHSGASIDVQHKSGKNLIFIAIDNHSSDIVKLLINNKQLLSTTYKKQNPLHKAVSMNGLDIVKILVAAGVNPYLKNNRGDNAFDLAQEHSDEVILKWLLTNRSFEILEESQCEQIKVAALENLFEKYGYKYLNDRSAERNSTIAEAAAKMQQIEILLWLKSKDISVDESLIRDLEAFRKALFNGEFDVASTLRPQLNIDTRYHNGNTCLMEACVTNNVEVFEWLVDRGANVNVQDKSGRNLIFMAINSKSVNIVKWLSNKSLLYTIYNGNYPLHEAILLSQLDMVKILVHAGIDPDVQNESKYNSFDLAQTQSDKTILEWLLTNKSFKIMHAPQSEESKIATLENLFDKYGYQYLNLRSPERNLTIAEYALKMQEGEVLKWLISNDIPMAEALCATATASMGRDFKEALLNHKFDVALKLLPQVEIEKQDYNGNTYLMRACITNNVEAFKWLMQNGANIGIQNKSGRNLIFAAIDSGSFDIINLLIDKMELVNAYHKGQTPLHEVVLANQLDLVKLLINAGVDPNTKNQFKSDAFNLAQEHDDKEILKWLLTNQAFKILDAADDEENKIAALEKLFGKHGYQYLNEESVERKSTIAKYAADMKQIDVLWWLKSKNISVNEELLYINVNKFEDTLFNHEFVTASKYLSKLDVNAQDYSGHTYLVKACRKNDVKVFDWLMQNGADINIQDKSGRSLIFMAIEYGSLDIVKWLVKDKRLLSTKFEGQPPLHEAVLSNQLEMVKLMIASKVDPYCRNKHGINAFDFAQKQKDKNILKWLLTNRSFEILDETESVEEKVIMLENLFSTYGFEYLNIRSPERKATIAEYAAKMEEIEVLNWLRYCDLQVYDRLLDDTKKELINIVLLGETGVDKSIFINAFANYLNFQTLEEAEDADDIQSVIPSKFTVTDERFRLREIKFGDNNESDVPQSTKCYTFETFNLKIQLFDTPAIGDTRSIGQDETNLENMLTVIGEETDIHGICMLLKPNRSRLNVSFEYCVKELLSSLQKDASRNIIFVFTNSRGTSYQSGDAVTQLEAILDEIKSRPPNIDIPFSEHNTFCLDNEAFKFLIAKKNNIQFKDDERDNFSKSWSISAKTSMNLINYIASIQPHKIQDTISLNETRRIILRLCKPLAETAQLIEMNIRQNNRYKELLSGNTKHIDELSELLLTPVIKLKITDLSYPMTVCTNLDCVDIVTFEGVSQRNYKTVCHEHCNEVKNVYDAALDDEALMNCWVMETKGDTMVCRHDFCGHDFREHMHVYYKTETYESEDEDKEVAMKIKRKQKDIQDIQNKINDLDATIKEYEGEKEIIRESMAKFAHFLKNNAITPYNDTYQKYIKYLIDSENKLGDAGNRGLMKDYEELIKKYEQYQKTLDEQLNQAQQLDPNQKAIVNAEEVTNLLKYLFTLKHTGETIRKLHSAKKTAVAAEIVESTRALAQSFEQNRKSKQNTNIFNRFWKKSEDKNDNKEGKKKKKDKSTATKFY